METHLNDKERWKQRGSKGEIGKHKQKKARIEMPILDEGGI